MNYLVRTNIAERRRHDSFFDLNIPTREYCENGGPERDHNALYYYTDCSTSREGVGGPFPPSRSFGYNSLRGNGNTIIYIANILIFSDSQANIKAPSSRRNTSNTVYKFLKAFKTSEAKESLYKVDSRPQWSYGSMIWQMDWRNKPRNRLAAD